MLWFVGGQTFPARPRSIITWFSLLFHSKDQLLIQRSSWDRGGWVVLVGTLKSYQHCSRLQTIWKNPNRSIEYSGFSLLSCDRTEQIHWIYGGLASLVWPLTSDPLNIRGSQFARVTAQNRSIEYRGLSLLSFDRSEQIHWIYRALASLVWPLRTDPLNIRGSRFTRVTAQNRSIEYTRLSLLSWDHSDQIHWIYGALGFLVWPLRTDPLNIQGSRFSRVITQNRSIEYTGLSLLSCDRSERIHCIYGALASLVWPLRTYTPKNILVYRTLTVRAPKNTDHYWHSKINFSSPLKNPTLIILSINPKRYRPP